MYLERLSSTGLDTLKYFKPNGLFNTSNPNSDIQMPNCTMYCYLRAFEATNAKAPFNVARNSLGFSNAKYWFNDSPLDKGFKLKNGSIACFDGNYGHVAFVERVIDDTHALISESQYDSNKSIRGTKYWNLRTVELIKGKATLSGVGALQGFLYLPIEDIRTIRNATKEQIEILDERVNVRDDNLEIFEQGTYAPIGIYNVLDKKEIDNYTWFKLGTNNWVRSGDWLRYYPVNNYDELIKENIELKERLKKIMEVAHYE